MDKVLYHPAKISFKVHLMIQNQTLPLIKFKVKMGTIVTLVESLCLLANQHHYLNHQKFVSQFQNHLSNVLHLHHHLLHHLLLLAVKLHHLHLHHQLHLHALAIVAHWRRPLSTNQTAVDVVLYFSNL